MDLLSMRRLFVDPPKQYRHLAIIHGFRPGPGYAWQFDSNVESAECVTNVQRATRRRLQQLVDRGFGGVVANVVGPGYLENEENWREFLDGVDAAIELGLRIWIYDEDGYPSGAAGGLVLRDHPEHEAQGLVCMRQQFGAGDVAMRPPTGWLRCVRAETRAGGVVSDVTCCVGADGWLRFEAAQDCEVVRFDSRRAFEGTHATRNVHRTRRYINVLSHAAVASFFDVTAQRYIDRMGERLKHVEAVFTDEPSFMAAYFPELSEAIRGSIQDAPAEEFDQIPMIAWDPSLPERFVKRWRYELLPEMGRLFAGEEPRDVRVRHDFYQMLSEVYADSFFAQQQRRLSEHGIDFSGHVLAEETMPHHVASQANLLADLKQMGIPGVDVLTSVPEDVLNGGWMMTCKFGSSAAHAAGRRQLMCESGDFTDVVEKRNVTLRQRHAAVAAQMAFGVTTITSYFTWDQYPDSEIRPVLDSWARIAAVLRNTTHACDVAVLYPIRTAWAHYRPVDCPLWETRMDEPLDSLDGHLMRIARGLLGSGLDFDFLDTRDLIGASVDQGRLSAGDEEYATLIVPPGAVMCPKDLSQMEAFAGAGGRVLAFEPCSTVALAEIASPPDGRDIGPGRTPDEVIARLAAEYPETVRRLPMDSNWLEFAAAAEGTRVTFSGANMVARRSRDGGSEYVLVVNAGADAATADVVFDRAESIEVWDPWTGDSQKLEPGPVHVVLEDYSALIVVGTNGDL